MGVSEWKHGRAIAFCMDNVSRGVTSSVSVAEGSVHVANLKGPLIPYHSGS